MTKKLKMGILKFKQGHIITHDVYVFVTVSGTRRIGKVLGINQHTIWVLIKQGATSYFVINRHLDKNNVTYYKEEEII